ncbi:DUF2071 domain-containing protein [Oryzihumus leptocrescens]|uniref:Uncharacterized protein DUF2071 n=1 Tax=Oryzihumus leptocrescens TaxID=297536 RepID=A0A542Z9T2_9MICO|nr:DUF2071 domain-containing protein [Oryzihumus leptocrescens]TQL57085.1 uncharacterized protein DUF2071 [Oryzihumus leptocrescens]
MIPRLSGEIERRLLVNYRVDPAVIGPLLPAPFRPQIVDGAAVAGICLIRLGAMRPTGFPAWIGRRSENAAHRIAVEWDAPEGTKAGVYIPRRDTDSMLNVAVGGHLYPGQHHRARFRVRESETEVAVAFAARDGSVEVDVAVRVTAELAGSKIFADVSAASEFFERGSLGYSATDQAQRLDGLQLHTNAWKVEPVEVLSARSSYFDDAAVFPTGSVALDCALIMRRVPVQWSALPTLATKPLGTDAL